MRFHANVRQLLLSMWRSVLLRNTLLRNQGTLVLEGKLNGMDFLDPSTEGSHIAKLLGSDEQPIHNATEQGIEAGYRQILNFGSAKGCYAVGFRRRMSYNHGAGLEPGFQSERRLAIRRGLVSTTKYMLFRSRW